MSIEYDEKELGTPQTPGQRLVLRLLLLFLEATEEIIKRETDPAAETVIADAELAFHAALGTESTFAEAREFLKADHWHRESARMDLLALRLLFRDHERLQRAVDAANARRTRRPQVA